MRIALYGTTPRPLPNAGELARLASARDDLISMFISRATAAGMTVRRTRESVLTETVRSLLESLNARRIALSVEDAALRSAIEGVVPDVIQWRRAPGLEALYDADAGVTDVMAAIAETGTLVVRSSGATTRGAFLVPPVHVPIVRASRLLPDMVDLMATLRPIPSSVVMITGPSKTADIEGILVTGVHGPKDVHIVLIDDA